MNTNDITFIPSIVRRGRKFKGFAYYVGEGSSYTMGYAGSGVFPLRYVSNGRLWDPAQKKYVYANNDFIEDFAVDAAKLEADKQAYIEDRVGGTIAWCKSQKPNAPEDEILRFARNCIRKRNPEFLPIIEAKIATTQDTRPIAAEVFRTLDWASKLTTRPMMIYGKMCQGGKPYPQKKVLSIAWTALSRKGFTQTTDGQSAWTLWCTMHQFNKGEQFMKEQLEAQQ